MISAALAVENEADVLPATLVSLGFCDEVVVVDGGSTDGTVEIARRFGARVIEHPSSDGGVHANKNRACEAARGDWILSLDADERVTPALADEIRAAVSRPEGPDAYSIPRKTYWGDRWVRACGWWPARTIRLFRKGTVRWPDEIHGVPVCSGTVGELREPLEHRSIRDWDDWMRKVRHFSAVEAVEMHRAGRRATWLRLAVAPPVVFLRKWLFQGGISEGRVGFYVSVSAALAVFFKYARLAEIEAGSPLPDVGGRDARKK